MEKYVNQPENDPSFGLPENQNPGKRNIFSTPANYFDKLPLEVADKIHSGDRQTSEFSFSSLFTTTRLIGFATILTFVIAGSILLWNKKENDQRIEPILSLEDISNTGLVSELDENMLFDEYYELNNFKDSLSVQTDLDAAELQEYLIENNTDITLIINEL